MTFRHKKHDSSLNRNPGPGNYNSISMNMGGKYPISHFRNATSIIFGCSKDTRFKYKSNYLILLSKQNTLTLIKLY